MKKLLLFAALFFSSVLLFAQTTCTVTGTSPLNWDAAGAGIVCSEGGNAVGKSILVIPSGFTVNFNSNGDTWTGTRIEVLGTLNISFDVQINSSIVVKGGGLLNIGKKLALGSTAGGCAYTLTIDNGGGVTVEDTGTDRLSICGNDVIKGNGCNNCAGNYATCPLPYCEPPGGFTGPIGFDDEGYNPTLPIKLVYFTANPKDEGVQLQWATSMEKDFYSFIVQRSDDGLTFEKIGEVPGKGFDIYDIVSKYTFEDEAPLLGYNYYRLKAVDLDDSFEYFGVKAVKVDAPKKLAVYPNPSLGHAIAFRTNFSPEESDRIVLTDGLGVEIFKGSAITVNDNIILPRKLTPGVYMLRYISEGFEQVTRVVVRN